MGGFKPKALSFKQEWVFAAQNSELVKKSKKFIEKGGLGW